MGVDERVSVRGAVVMEVNKEEDGVDEEDRRLLRLKF